LPARAFWSAAACRQVAHLLAQVEEVLAEEALLIGQAFDAQVDALSRRFAPAVFSDS